ncbi:MAG TPA: STAS domain-containing protein [Rugosimonospora sp.]|jgi:anti-anti-sigma factor
MSLRIRLETDGTAVTIRLAGDLDLATEHDVRESIAAALDGDGLDGGAPDSLTVDLADVAFLDCRGLSTLIHGRHVADAHRIAFRVRNATGIPASVLRLTGTLDYLTGLPDGSHP